MASEHLKYGILRELCLKKLKNVKILNFSCLLLVADYIRVFQNVSGKSNSEAGIWPEALLRKPTFHTGLLCLTFSPASVFSFLLNGKLGK